MLSTVPQEIVYEVLSWLPVVDLIRLKRTCRLWCRIIRDPLFIKLHLNRSHQIEDNWVVLAPQYHAGWNYSDRPVEIFSERASFGWIVTGKITNTTLRNFQVLLPTICYDSGLICFLEFGTFDKFTLWNPLTTTFKSFTVDPILCAGGGVPLAVGFGYDAVGDDYKFVQIVRRRYEDNENLSLVHETRVFSSKNNSIRTVQNWPFDDILAFTSQLCIHGAIHWCKTYFQSEEWCYPVVHPPQLQMEKKKLAPPDTIVSFDLTKQEFKVQHMPLAIFNDRKRFQYLSTGLTGLRGFLSVYVNCGDTHEVWIMKEYAKYESWTKLYSLGKFFSDIWKPLLLSNKGDKVLLEFYKNGIYATYRCWYDIERKIGEICNKSSTLIQMHNGFWITESFGLPGSLLLTEDRDWPWNTSYCFNQQEMYNVDYLWFLEHFLHVQFFY